MKSRDIYKKAVEIGIENDPRGKDAVLKELDRRKKDFDDLKPDEKEFFDQESLQNPYSDSRILYGTGAEGLMDRRIKEVERKLMPVNHTRAVDAARLLGIPFLCLHTPADNMVASYLQRLFDEKKPYLISDVMSILKDIPEYKDAGLHTVGPSVFLGAKNRKAGKIFVDMTGGTEGAKEIFESLTTGGVSTIVAMHLSEEHRKEAEKNHLNVVIAGHISSDNLGLNLLLDEITRGNAIEILECSGFKRFSR